MLFKRTRLPLFRLVFQLNRWMLLLAAYSSSSVSKEEISSLDTSLLPAAGSRVASSFTFGHYSCLLGFLEFTSRFCSKTWRWFIHSYRHNQEMFELNSALKIDLRHHRFTASFWETKINIQHFRFLLLQKEAKKKNPEIPAKHRWGVLCHGSKYFRTFNMK